MSLETRDQSSSGSLLGVGAIALLAMALLAFGYNSNKDAMVADNAPAASTQTTGAATRAPSAPTGNQPANPAPDTRDAPTGSNAGSGADNGGPAKAPDNAAPKQ